MSIPRSTTITCPKCGKQFQTTTFDSLNTDFAPDVAESVISGKRFDCKCPSCGEVSHLCYDFLYHDIKHNAMIWLVGYENTEAEEKIDEIRSEPTPGIKTTRIVRDISSLREKAACLEAGRDDRIIELCKVFLEIELMNQRPDLRVKRSFYSNEGGKESVYLYDENNKELHTELDDRIYYVVSELFKQLLSGMEETPYQIIDHEWAAEVFGKLHESPPDLDPNSVAEKYQATKSNTPDLVSASNGTSQTVRLTNSINSTASNKEQKNKGAKHTLVKVLIYIGFCLGYGLIITLLSHAGVRGGLVVFIVGALTLYGASKMCAAFDERCVNDEKSTTPAASVSDKSKSKKTESSGSKKHEFIAAPEDNTFEIDLSDLPMPNELESIQFDFKEKGLSPTLRRAFLLLEDGDWEKADDYLERVLDEDPENAFAYLGKLLQSHHIKSAQDLFSGSSIPSDDGNLQKALRFSEDADLTGLLKQLSSGSLSIQAPLSENTRDRASLPKKKKSDKAKTRKKLKPLTIVLLSSIGLLLVAFGTYFGTYFAAKSKAYQGEYEKAQRLLIVPALTEKMDPELGEYIKNGIAYQDALSDLRNGNSFGYRRIVSLSKSKFSPAEQHLEEIQSMAYDIAVNYYRDGQTLKAAEIFKQLGDYKRSIDYLTLFNKSNISKIKELIGFENAHEILINTFAEEFLSGTWKTSDGAYYFSFDESSNRASYNLPHNYVNAAAHEFQNGIYTVTELISNTLGAKTNLFRFKVIDVDTITINCFKDGSTYTLYRQ